MQAQLTLPITILLDRKEDEYPEHTSDHPFCSDFTCPCKLDECLLWEVSRWIEHGLMTQAEGEAFVAGQTL